MAATRRNDPCPCDSGKKYKQCCMASGGAEAARRSKVIQGTIIVAVLAALVIAAFYGLMAGLATAGAGVALVVGYILATNTPGSSGGSNPSSINFGQ